MTLGKPDATYHEDVYRFEWPDIGISASVERFAEERNDVRCELTVTSAHPTRGGQLYFGRLALMGPLIRKQVKEALEKRDREPDWAGILEQVCTLSLRRYREGEPAIDLWSAEIGGPGRYLVKPFCFDYALNLLYGSGDSGKSLFSQAIAIAVATGHEIAGLVPEREGAVIICDWEDSPQTHQERIKAMCAKLGIVVPEGRIIYRRMDASLRESARELRKDIAKYNAVLVILDSIGMACGGDPGEASAIIQTMIAARSLGVTVLGIHHIAKEAKDKSTPYGSVYASNEARMSWYVQSERQGTQLTMVLTNYKSNRGARHERQSFRFDFAENDYEVIESITITPLTFAQSKAVGDGGQKWKIADYLKLGARSVSDIAEGTGLSRNSVSAVLGKHEGVLFTRLDRGVWGLALEKPTVGQPKPTVGETNPTSPPFIKGGVGGASQGEGEQFQTSLNDNGDEPW